MKNITRIEDFIENVINDNYKIFFKDAGPRYAKDGKIIDECYNCRGPMMTTKNICGGCIVDAIRRFPRIRKLVKQIKKLRKI